MTIRVWPARKSIEGNISYSYAPMKVIDEEKIDEITKLCQKLFVECHAIEDPSQPATKMIITIPYKEEK